MHIKDKEVYIDVLPLFNSYTGRKHFEKSIYLYVWLFFIAKSQIVKPRYKRLNL